MILNHKNAIELLVQSAEKIGFNRYTILNLRALLADNLLSDPQAVGRLRPMSVLITGSVYEPLAVPQLINECFDVPEKTYVRGMLGVYELNRIELLKDVFHWAYERSAARYVAIRQSLGEPDPFRMRYREAMRDIVADVATVGMDQKRAADAIAAKALQLPEADQARFIEIVETELLALHEGNFACYRVRPSVFNTWRAIWNASR
jgi:hypothetical protein